MSRSEPAPSSSAEPVLVFDGLAVHFGDTVAVRDFTVPVAAGERVGVIGESGSGKTTIGLAAMGIVQGGGRIAAGSVRIAGRTVLRAGDGARARLSDRRMAMVFQDPKLSFDPLRTVQSHLVETMAARGIPRAEWSIRAVTLLSEVGLPDPATLLRKFPHELSGGQRQRAMIAVALAADPEVLIADEPTSSLDVTTQAAIMDLLDRVSRAREMAIVLISHDIELVRSFVDRVLVMRSGDVVEAGPTESVIGTPEHEYTKTLLGSVPEVPPVSEAVVALVNGAPAEAIPLDESGVADEDVPGAVVRTENLTRVFRLRAPGARRRTLVAASDVTLTLRPGESLGLVGGSGSGKTTTARMIAGLLQPSGGTVRIRTAANGRTKGNLQMVFQDPADTLDPLMTVAESIAEPLRIVHGGSLREHRSTVAELLESVGLGEQYAQRKPAQLSGGQRQRVAIARALSTRPDVIVADEPVSALDASLRVQILGLFGELRAKYGVSILQITHDLLTARISCDRIAVMREGRIVEIGDSDQLFADPQHPYTRQLIASIPAVRATYGARAH